MTAPIPPIGHVPMAAAVADHVVQEAAVLAQVGVVGACEGPDERVGESDAAQRVVAEAVLDELADRALDERRPGRVVADERAQLGGRAQRLGHRRPQRAGRPRARRVQALPALDGRRVAGRGPQRGGGALAVLGVDQHAAGRVGGQRRVGRDPPPAEPDLQAQLVDDRSAAAG